MQFNDLEININDELNIAVYQSDTTQGQTIASNDWSSFTVRDVVNSGYISIGDMYLKGSKPAMVKFKRLPSVLFVEVLSGTYYVQAMAFPRSSDYVDKIRWISLSCSGGTIKAGTTIEAFMSKLY